ncbi:MAG: hypothetical protein K9N46_08575 [Candidatus Marinimicrobia bacterium]|nr:hypothetical protein [Candidatus Neomarinimicrobiota bacterium]MCF7828862.1 hypothetical protein [Candidatus Neomarinimicrobiota bacterium]MCF7880779.1 hypothetical protein [Candidatus Neomarinimicrobiota bacterium]
MNTKRIILAVTLVSAFLTGCDSLLVQSQENHYSEVQLSLFSDDNTGFSKIAFIDRVDLKITGPDIEQMEETLTIRTIDGQRVAMGEFEVEKGDLRRFAISGKDAAGRQLFHGMEVRDLDKNKENVEIALEWDPVVLSYDDGDFEEFRYALESQVEFITEFHSPVYPLDLVGVRLYIRGDYDFDIDILDSEGNYLDTKPAAVRTAGFGWQIYELESLNLDFSDRFFISVYIYDGPDQNNTYGPHIGLDTSTSGNSWIYDPSGGSYQEFSEGNFGIQAIVLFDGVTKAMPVKGTVSNLSRSFPKIEQSERNR